MTLRSAVRALFEKEQPSVAGLPAAKPKQPVRQELGATGTSVFAGMLYEEDYNADLRGEKALRVYDKMRKSDGQVKAGLLACKLPLMVAKWDVQAASEDPADVMIAATVKADLMENMTITWSNFLRQTLIMLDFGHMVFEKVWTQRQDGGNVRDTWHKLAPRLPQSIAEWHIKEDGDLDYIVQQTTTASKFIRPEIPADKLVVFTHEMEGSNYRGVSLLRAAYKHWFYKNNLYAIDGIAAERHGVGLAAFSYPDNATAEQKDAIKEMGERLHAHEKSFVAYPESFKFDLKGVQGQLHDIRGSIDHHDLQIVRSILAQFMNLGAKSTGSYALSQDQSEFFLMALQSVGKNVCDTMNRDVIREMVDYNWNVSHYPKLTVSGLDSLDVLGYAEAISNLVTSGAITTDNETENELRRLVKLPYKKPTAVTPPSTPATSQTAPETNLRASEFWRAPIGVEKAVAFADIQQHLDTFEDTFIKAIAPIQKKQAKALVSTVAGYIADGQYERITEIDVPLRAQVADAVDTLLLGMADYGAEQVRQEAKKQGATVKAKDGDKEPVERKSLIRVRALAIANILANQMRAALAWEAIEQLRDGKLDRDKLNNTLDELSTKDAKDMAAQSASEALNLGRQEQAKTMGVKKIISSSLLDDHTCGFCKGEDGKTWVPGQEPSNAPPYRQCDGRTKCRCLWVYVFDSEQPLAQ